MEIQIHPETGERIWWRRWIVKHGKGAERQREYTVATYSTEEAANEVVAVLNKHRDVAVSPAAWMGEYWVKESVMRVAED